jgi:ubiquitin-activating enzyme E1 C
VLKGVTKRIIPAIASTNAVIAAACANEAFKVATNCSPYLNNYMMYNGLSSVYTYTFSFEKKSSCPVCGTMPLSLTVDPNITLEELKDRLATDAKL